MILYATLETSTGKTVSVSDNEQITATVYDKNMKAYSIIIEWANIGDPEGSEAEGGIPHFGAIVTTREWRNQPEAMRKKKTCDGRHDSIQAILKCDVCGKHPLLK